MSCVGCNDGCFDESVQLAQGPVGPAGAPGGNGEDGEDGNDGNGIVSITLDSTVGNVDTYEITYTESSPTTFDVTNGTDGDNGTTLLKSITSEQTVTASSYPSGSVFSHSVVANSLFSDEDTLKFEGLVLNTEDDQSLVGLQIQFASTDLQIGFAPTVFDWPNLEMKNIPAYEIWIDIVRVSSSSVRIESKIRVFNSYNLSIYSGSVMFPGGGNFQDYIRLSQTITSLDLVNTPYTFQVNLQTDSVSRPTKLTKGKLYLIKK